jgi:MIP family channel proteins
VLHVTTLDLRPEIAEAIGTFALVLAGCGAIVADALPATASVSTTGIALAFGSTIAVMVYALAHVSGAHFNPAITLGFAATTRFPWRRAPTYVLAQLAGATAAAGVIVAVLGTTADAGATVPHASVSISSAIVVEVLATALLAFVIAACATDERVPDAAGGLAIGLAVTIGAIFAGPLTGGSMNPARTLGPAIASGTWTQAWIYLVGPAIGSLGAMTAYQAGAGADYGNVLDTDTPDPSPDPEPTEVTP